MWFRLWHVRIFVCRLRIRSVAQVWLRSVGGLLSVSVMDIVVSRRTYGVWLVRWVRILLRWFVFRWIVLVLMWLGRLILRGWMW